MKNTVDGFIAALRFLKKAYTADGGKGSGNFNHAGRPGEIGGSAPDKISGGSNKIAKAKTTDVTEEYTSKAKPNSGTIKIASNYNKINHQDEIAIAHFLHKTFGGDIELLAESNAIGRKSPDYKWHGKYWELKSVSSLTSTDDQLRSALKQIRNLPGGVILSYKKLTIPMSKIESVIQMRLARSSKLGVDVMIVVNGKVKKIIREK